MRMMTLHRLCYEDHSWRAILCEPTSCPREVRQRKKVNIDNIYLCKWSTILTNRSQETMPFRFALLWTVLLALSIPSFSFRHEVVSSTTLEDGDGSLLEVFQAFPPPLNSKDLLGSTACSFLLMNHVFANSEGKPYVGAIVSYSAQLILV